MPPGRDYISHPLGSPRRSCHRDKTLDKQMKMDDDSGSVFGVKLRIGLRVLKNRILKVTEL